MMLIKRLPLLIAGGIGYVLGTKAGRERYEQIRATFDKVKDDPRVQEKTQQAADLAKEKAPVVKEKVAEATDKATTKVKRPRRLPQLCGRQAQPREHGAAGQPRPEGRPALVGQ